jgi:hypothetical protein
MDACLDYPALDQPTDLVLCNQGTKILSPSPFSRGQSVLVVNGFGDLPSATLLLLLVLGCGQVWLGPK